MHEYIELSHGILFRKAWKWPGFQARWTSWESMELFCQALKLPAKTGMLDACRLSNRKVGNRRQHWYRRLLLLWKCQFDYKEKVEKVEKAKFLDVPSIGKVMLDEQKFIIAVRIDEEHWFYSENSYLETFLKVVTVNNIWMTKRHKAEERPFSAPPITIGKSQSSRSYETTKILIRINNVTIKSRIPADIECSRRLKLMTNLKVNAKINSW